MATNYANVAAHRHVPIGARNRTKGAQGPIYSVRLIVRDGTTDIKWVGCVPLGSGDSGGVIHEERMS